MTRPRHAVSDDGVTLTRTAGDSAPTSPLPGRSMWQRTYVQQLRVSDTIVVVAAASGGAIVRFGPSSFDSMLGKVAFLGYVVLSVILAAAWLTLLAVSRSRSPRVIGSGAEEYRRVVSATGQLFGAIAIVCLVFQIDLARGYLAVALPAGLLGLLFTRRAWRGRVARLRAKGMLQTSVLVVGGTNAALSLASSFQRESSIGYTVVGVCMPGHHGAPGDSVTVGDRTVPIFGDEHSVVDALAFCRADTVAVTATEQLGAKGIRDLAWALEPFDVDLVVSPGVVDVSGPRLAMRPVAGLPLIHVEKPQYNGTKRFGKTAFDMVFASAALLVTAPLLLIIAAAIKLDSKGPVLYRSERIGLDGTAFGMIKFRSMVVGADQRLDSLLASNDSEGGVLFKMRDDPRVTRVGGILRRLSMDELPQFLNVLRREMSVVGPRPPLRREVETYDGHVRRRLLVKPGITGLWQVAGRSDLSWDESVRLDLSYVENWSMVGDMLIVVKTIKAVTRSSGAY